MVDKKNYFVLGYAWDLRYEVQVQPPPAPPERVPGTVWVKEYNYQPNKTFSGDDVATHIDASGAYVAVTGYSGEPNGDYSVQSLLLNRLTGGEAQPVPAFRFGSSGLRGMPIGVRLVDGGALGECMIVAATFRAPNYPMSSYIVAKVYHAATGAELGSTTYAPGTGVDVDSSGHAMVADGLCVYIAGTQTAAPGQPSKMLLTRLDPMAPANNWAVVYATPGGSGIHHVATSVAMGRDGNQNTMVAVTGLVGSTTGTHSDMLTVLFSGIGSGVLSPRWFAQENHSSTVELDDWGTAVLIQPESELNLWRVYTTGVVTNGSGNRDWRTLMYKSLDLGGLPYPVSGVTRRDFIGPSGDDEPAAMIFSSQPGGRKLFVAGYSNQMTATAQSGDDFYVQKYEDITP